MSAAPLTSSEAIRRLYARNRRDGTRAIHALRYARAKYARDPAQAIAATRYDEPTIWSRVEPNGAPCRVGGKRGRWIESATLAGLRRVGTAGEIGVVGHRGWYMDPSGQGETVSGVVYQLPAHKGKVRYLAGYDDPFGNGGAFLAVELFEADDWRAKNPKAKSYGLSPQDIEAESAKREAASHGDRIAERMAEDERNRAECYEAGAKVRELAREAHEAGRAWAKLIREARNTFATRKARGVVGITLAETLAAFRDQKERIRVACERYQDALEKARSARNDIGAWAWREHGDAIREGYDNG